MGWIKEERRERTKEDQGRMSGREKDGNGKRNEKRRGKGTKDKRGGKWKIGNQMKED